MTTITNLGDVHLGRKFTNGVPLNRRGDREWLVWQAFEASLMDCDTEFHIQPGDLFDMFAVPEALVLQVAAAYRKAASRNEDTTYVIMRGNHDASRDTSKASSFDVLVELLADVDNIHILRDVTIIETDEASIGYDKCIGFIPWHPFKSAEELAQELVEKAQDNGRWPGVKLLRVYGHFETESYGGDDFNLIPTKTLSQITDEVYTGHIHLPGEFERDGVKVTVVGSMQPYAHGEDADGQWYQTVDYQTVLEILNTEPSIYQDMNVRVIVKPGEVVPEIPGVLAQTTKPYQEKAVAVEDETLEVRYEDFNMRTLFNGCLAAKNISPTIADKITAKYEELKNV